MLGCGFLHPNLWDLILQDSTFSLSIMFVVLQFTFFIKGLT